MARLHIGGGNGFLCVLVRALLGVSLLAAPVAVEAQSIVTDGRANAQIVIAEERPRMVTLAALELQYYIEQISGAR